MSRVATLTIIVTLVAACGEDVSLGGGDAAPPIDAPSMVTLTIGSTGTGDGRVVSTPAGIDCGADCAHDFVAGTTVTLIATAATGVAFAGWSGACTGTGPCTVVLTADTAVTAGFTPSVAALTVTTAGTGTGEVASSPTGIDCGADCSEDYAVGTTVTLIATPTAGSTFTGWSGACGGTGTCDVVLTGDTAVTATFTATTCSLTVDVIGSGTVVSSPSGILCGTDCTEDYACGTFFTLTAAPAAGWVFVGWSGACSGGGTCPVPPNASVTATFVLAS